ncbi:MAG: HD domain-containing protein [Deltaproteobacteria bacterium]
MPSKIYVSEIKENDKVESYLLVKDKNIAMAKNGKPYINVKLMDKSGEIEGRVWDNAEEIARQFEKNDIVVIKGRGALYQGKIQLSLIDVRKAPEGVASAGDFLPRSERDPDEMLSELKGIISGIKEQHLKRLMDSFMDDKSFVEMFKAAPAAKGMHHVYIGGLLEHTLSVAHLVVELSRHYGSVNKDILLTGSILHDMGKTRELSYRAAFDYTDEGRLLGHIIIGIRMLDEKIEGIEGFPEKTALLLRHMIASHHGELEFGSPKRPKTLEALLLHHIEDMDAKANAYQIAVAKETNEETNWTPYQKMFERYLYKGE